jgi:GMP synthase (glutamine-hydrolysing)
MKPISLSVAVLQHERETGLGAFAGLLDRAGVRYELLRTSGVRLPDAAEFDGVLVLGGSQAANDPALLETRRWIRNVVLCEVPILGVCLGGQLLATALGSSVGPALHPEVGVHDAFRTSVARHDPLFSGLSARFPVFGWHEDEFELPHGAISLAGSLACEHQAFRFATNAYGLQFHSEVRPEDLNKWADVRGYARLIERATARWDEVAAELDRATPELDELAGKLLKGWLGLVADRGAVGERRLRVAV